MAFISRLLPLLGRVGVGALLLHSSPLAVADPTGTKPVFDVRLFYSTDWDQAIRDAVSAASDIATRNCSGAVVFFPEGLYTVYDTINLEPVPGGLDFVGAGGSPFPPSPLMDPLACPAKPGTAAEVVTVIKLLTDARPLIRIAGFGITFTNMTLDGPDVKPGDYNLATLVQTTDNYNTACTSTLTFRGVFFRFAEFGIALATPGDWQSNCNSEVLLERVGFIACRTGLRCNTEQGGNIIAFQTGANACRSVFDFEEGPINFSFDTGTFTGCGGEGDDEWIFNFRGGGPNNGNAKIVNAHFDLQSNGQPCSQFVRLAGDHLVTLETSIQGNWITPLAEKGSNPTTYDPVIEVLEGNLLVTNCRFFSFPIVELKDRVQPLLFKSIRFRDCALPTPPGDPPLGWNFNHAGLFRDSQTALPPADLFGMLFDGCSKTSFEPIERWTNYGGW